MYKLQLILAITWITGHLAKVEAQTFTYPVAPTIQSAASLNFSGSFSSTTSQLNSVASSSMVSPNAKIHNLLVQVQQQLNKDDLPGIEETRDKLESALRQLERFLGEGSANAKLWSAFLRIPEMKQQLEAERPSYARLLDLAMNMRQNYVGLEYIQFVQVRDALHQFAFAARFHNQEEGFIKFLNDLLETAQKAAQEASSVDGPLTQQLVTITNNLYQSQQAKQQLFQLRELFSAKNVRITVNGSLLNRLAAQPVSRPQAVDEIILGTRVLGSAYMDGSVSLNLLPMHNGVGLQLNLSACLSSRSRGHNRGIVFNSTSSSPVIATKQVFISETGVSSSTATVSTQLNSTINSVEHRSRLVRRIASRKAAQQKPLADSIAQGRLQSRVQQQFSEQVDQQANQAQARLTELRHRQLPEIQRLGFEKPQLMIASSSAAIHADTILADTHQLSATGSCPLPQSGTSSMIGEIHESAFCNALATILGGRTVRNHELGDFVKQITGKIPDDLKDEIEGEAWSITFNPSQPIRVELDDDMIAITIRLVRLFRGEQSLNDELSITAKYLPMLQGDRLTLTRQGEVVVSSDKHTRGTRAANLRSFLRSKFDKTFRASIVTEPLSLAKLQARLPAGSNLHLDIHRVSFRIDQGWLQVSINL